MRASSSPLPEACAATPPLGDGSPEDSRALILKPALTENCDTQGHVEAGHLLKLMDVVGVVSAFRHFGQGNVFVTASLDRTNFVSSIHAWEYIRMDSRVTQVWQSSLETEVTVSAFGMRDRDSARHHVATAYLTYVALDGDRRKISLPPLQPQSEEDYRRAHIANLRRENRRQEAAQAPQLTIDATDGSFISEVVREMTPRESNSFGNVFGGVILELISAAGARAAARHAGKGLVIAARIDRMNFLAPAFVGETVRARALPTKSWNSSIEVQVAVEALTPGDPFHPRAIAQCYMVFVRLDERTERPIPLASSWEPATPRQRQRAEAADLRRHFREAEAVQAQTQIPPALSLWRRARFFWRERRARLKRCLALWKESA